MHMQLPQKSNTFQQPPPLEASEGSIAFLVARGILAFMSRQWVYVVWLLWSRSVMMCSGYQYCTVVMNHSNRAVVKEACICGGRGLSIAVRRAEPVRLISSHYLHWRFSHLANFVKRIYSYDLASFT